MMFKKLLILILVISGNLSAYSMDSLCGFWVKKEIYLNFSKFDLPDKRYFRSYNDVKETGRFESNGLRIRAKSIDGKDDINNESSGVWNYEILKRDDRNITIKIHAYDGNIITWTITKTSDPDVIIIEKEGYKEKTEYIRVSTPPGIPVVNAVVNDYGVRLRSKPNLNSFTWAKLGKGTECRVKDKSSETIEIDGEKWYWYCIDIKGYPDGWVCGKYLDLERTVQ